MNILSFTDVENYLQNKQVYFKTEICNVDFKTLAKSNTVYNVKNVEVKKIREGTIFINVKFGKKEFISYKECTDLEFFAWIKTNFIPVSELIEKYNN